MTQHAELSTRPYLLFQKLFYYSSFYLLKQQLNILNYHVASILVGRWWLQFLISRVEYGAFPICSHHQWWLDEFQLGILDNEWFLAINENWNIRLVKKKWKLLRALQYYRVHSGLDTYGYLALFILPLAPRLLFISTYCYVYNLMKWMSQRSITKFCYPFLLF